jgi:hypothetical protein
MKEIIKEILNDMAVSDCWDMDNSGYYLFLILEMNIRYKTLQERLNVYSSYGINDRYLSIELNNEELLEIAKFLEQMGINSQKDLSQLFPIIGKLPKDFGFQTLGKIVVSRESFSGKEIKQILWAIDLLADYGEKISDFSIIEFLGKIVFSSDNEISEKAKSFLL